MNSAFSWQNSISLCPASFCTPRPNFPVTPGVSWLPTFAFQSPIMKRTPFFWVWVLKGLVGLHRTVQLQLFSVTDWGIGLDYCDIEWFALEMNRDHSVIFEITSKYCILYSFVDYDGYSNSSMGLLVESFDKTWSTGEGNGKPLQYSCHEKPMNSMKRQKDRTLKDNSPGW